MGDETNVRTETYTLYTGALADVPARGGGLAHHVPRVGGSRFEPPESVALIL